MARAEGVLAAAMIVVVKVMETVVCIFVCAHVHTLPLGCKQEHKRRRFTLYIRSLCVRCGDATTMNTFQVMNAPKAIRPNVADIAWTEAVTMGRTHKRSMSRAGMRIAKP